jgi:protein disulfide-isomerase
MNPANPGLLLSCRPNPYLPLTRHHRRPHPPARADTTGAASAPDWLRPRRTTETDPSTSGGRVAARDPGVRVNAKEGADVKKKEEGRRRRWWERWSRDKESYLVDDVEPLPLPMTIPGADPMSPEELDRRLSCDIDIEVGSAAVKVIFFCWIGAYVWS